MNWKPYYRAELVRPEGRELIEGYFAEADDDPKLDAALADRAILSFPHTALPYAGPLQARVIAALHRAGVELIIALGVLHTSAIPAPYAERLELLRDPAAPLEERRAAFSQLSGAFIPRGGSIPTPFGSLTIAPVEFTEAVRPDSGILKNEFSLDTFFSLLAFYCRTRALPPPRVLPVYVGVTRDPESGSFGVGEEIARELAGFIGPKTAVVTTGDLVHYGTGYGDEERISQLPQEKEGLEAYFRREVEEVLARGLGGRRLEEAFQMSQEVLKSDQRYILPVLAGLLGPGAGYEILHFELSDYAGILSVAPPCYVASALVGFRAGRTKSGVSSAC
ncbi:hypothetical protein DRJ23_02835 [Candidatus Acetothermia bacterium]|nr:MAG: hypothetical protein DRJ23_02835 [Candidatus Acetothermia bacterium]